MALLCSKEHFVPENTCIIEQRIILPDVFRQENGIYSKKIDEFYY
jgi:hypothetical protein